MSLDTPNGHHNPVHQADKPISPVLAASILRDLLMPAFGTVQGWKSGRRNTWFTLSTKLFKLEFYGRVPSWSFEFALNLRPRYPVQMKAAVSLMAGFDLEIDLVRLAAAHNLPLSLSGVLPGGENQYTMFVNCGRAAEGAAAELAGVLAHALPLLAGIDSWHALDHWANRVQDADCPFRFLRRPAAWSPMNDYADLAIAKAANAPDFAARASGKLLRYRQNGTPMVVFLEGFIAACDPPA